MTSFENKMTTFENKMKENQDQIDTVTAQIKQFTEVNKGNITNKLSIYII